jgi:hypothetical protein
MQRVLQLVLVHAGKEVERGVIVAHVFEAEMMILPFAAMPLGRTVLPSQLAALPIAHMLGRRGLFFPTRPDADGIEELGLQFHCA